MEVHVNINIGAFGPGDTDPNKAQQAAKND
jgi:hypothetical protein